LSAPGALEGFSNTGAGDVRQLEVEPGVRVASDFEVLDPSWRGLERVTSHEFMAMAENIGRLGAL
jgi:hypothetical protein